MKKCFSVATGFIAACLACFPKQGLSYDSPNPEKYRVKAVHIDRKIDLSGRLSDPLWKLSEPIEISYEIQPGENTPARQKTSVYVLYNSDYIYFGFNCLDSTANLVRAHITDRDKMTDDDFVGILLDTYGNTQGGYEFMVNPQGIQFDAARTGESEDASFDCMWYSAAQVNDTGYTVEIALPFKSLRFPSAPEQHWIAEFVRNMPRESRYQMTWTPIDRNNPCLFCQSGTIDGIEGAEASNNLELLPYVMGVQSSSLNDAGDPASGFAKGPVTGRIGAGIRYAPSSSFALAGVLNPDFSQIESDAAQISVNNTFAIFYPEKRPFFLEGADLYSTVASIFYSRMINNPLASVKITEKSGSFSLAYLGAEDRESPFIIPGEEESDFVSSSLKSWNNILRAKYNIGKESFVGGLVTTRNFMDAHNYVGTVDWSVLFGGNYYLTGQAGLTHTKEINDPSLFSSDRLFGSTSYTAAFDGESYEGSGYQVDITRNARNYSFDLGGVSVSPTFQAYDGYTTSTDKRQINFWQGYTVYFDRSFVENASLQTNSGVAFNYDGARKGEWGSIQAQANLRGQTYVWAAYYPVQEELFHSVQFHKLYRTEVQLNTNPITGFALYLWAQAGRLIYRVDSPDLGRGYNLSCETVVKPTDKFSLDLTYTRSRLWSFYTQQLFFDGYIARCAVVYQFSAQLFVRLISQYDQFAKQLQIDPLISYKLNPFTVFYAGSDHNFARFDEPYGMRRTVQQFFVKLQYLWQN
ncbi:MAG TPA: DUF5916 domain-containing protein [Candidatus Acidoferrales bacterium]|nr:DUF5916 domain-containing protein [Candidatus Acidoferrales bacterium]